MPEAAVDEHGDALGREDDVGPAPETRRSAVLEKAQTTTVKSRAQRSLGPGVRSAVSDHDRPSAV